MEKVPQIVSERLKAVSSAVDHPDADVLTAFSEHSLRKSERAAVVEHLARCGECREIVALALPVTESIEQTVRPADSTWLTWPVLRWGFVTAGIVAIASFGIIQYQRHSSMMAYQTARPEAIAKEAKNLPPVSPSPGSTEDRDKASAAPAFALTDRKDSSPSSASRTPSGEIVTPTMGGPVKSKSGMPSGALPHGPRVQWQQNPNVQQRMAQAPAKRLLAIPLQSAPPSASPETVEVQSESGALASVDSSAVQNKIDQQALQNGRTETKVERSKPAASTVANAPAVPLPGPARAQLIRQSAQAAAVPNASIRWTITATGRLQRSLDQGTTWQDIDVNSPSGAAGASLDLMKAPAKAREVAADSLAKKDASVSLVFRAVASNGPDVWAGTAGGFLYHSADAGGQWTRIVPSASGISLTGDIVSLEFVDPQHGRVVTSNAEAWTTSDGGQSWRKQ